MERAYREYGYTQAEIARVLGLHYATVSRLIKTVEDKMSKGLSGAGESHPCALPEPDVNLSIHPAPIVQPVTKRFCFIHVSPPLAGCSRSQAGRRHPFGPVPLQNFPPYYG
jgi:hypothetical protein